MILYEKIDTRLIQALIKQNPAQFKRCSSFIKYDEIKELYQILMKKKNSESENISNFDGYITHYFTLLTFGEWDIYSSNIFEDNKVHQNKILEFKQNCINTLKFVIIYFSKMFTEEKLIKVLDIIIKNKPLYIKLNTKFLKGKLSNYKYRFSDFIYVLRIVYERLKGAFKYINKNLKESGFNRTDLNIIKEITEHLYTQIESTLIEKKEILALINSLNSTEDDGYYGKIVDPYDKTSGTLVHKDQSADVYKEYWEKMISDKSKMIELEEQIPELRILTQDEPEDIPDEFEDEDEDEREATIEISKITKKMSDKKLEGIPPKLVIDDPPPQEQLQLKKRPSLVDPEKLKDDGPPTAVYQDNPQLLFRNKPDNYNIAQALTRDNQYINFYVLKGTVEKYNKIEKFNKSSDFISQKFVRRLRTGACISPNGFLLCSELLSNGMVNHICVSERFIQSLIS